MEMAFADEALKHLEQVEALNGEGDWATLFQHACINLWQALALSPEEDAPTLAILGRFENLLSQYSYFIIGRLVIPELRCQGRNPQDLGCSALQQQLLERVRPLIERYANIEQGSPMGTADPFFQAEKDILQEVRIQQLAILFAGDSRLDEQQKQEMKEWLETCPLNRQRA